ncbi:MAG: hypothetical protein IAX21_02935 [Candidatus Bathyarchaeota archaeon]|nr:hypothetical protein [Candidatus Bathyarchaeum tardum]WGM90029.1 MAG: hypothetical protein NUK63_02610 [Candidatus Bathyarchaeum tardum]WNZ29829.1 MAG: hypothetical protein IAX21_02935 [Candidatus Bathyarchaeota archaeon]
MSAPEETYDEAEAEEEEEETKLLNAEQVTTIATDFLKRLGNKQMLKPVKASLEEEEEIYVVEVALSKKIATVQVNATTEQIIEYEIIAKEQETPSNSFLPLTPQNIMVLAGTAIGSVIISALLGLQSLIPSIL